MAGHAKGLGKLSWLVLTALILTLAVGCSRGRPLSPARLADAEAIHRKVSDKAAPVHIELRQIVYRLEIDGTYERTFRQRYRVLDQQGVEDWSHTQAYWSPWYMKRPEFAVTITNRGADGKATRLELDQRTITEQPAHPDAPEIYSDARILRAPLPNVSVGSVVEEVITLRTHKPFLSKAHMHSIPFQIGIPQDKVELIVDAPNALEVFFDVREAKVERTETKTGDRTRVVFTGGPYSALEPPEPLIPSSTTFWPSVDFGTGNDWKPLAASYAKIVEEKLAGIDFGGTVKELVDPNDSDQLKAAKLYNWVKSRVRYVGIEFGESGVIPRAPDQTVSQGYGDCKDQATLLVGLLREAGLPAHVALLSVGSREDINGKLPALNVFDHAIVVVPSEPPLWFDSTADHVRPGSLPVGDQERLALVAAADTQGLVRTPKATPKTNTYQEHREVFLADQGPAKIIERSSGTGYLDSELREAFSVAPTNVKENLEAYAERTYSTKTVNSIKHGKGTDLLEPFHVQFEASRSKIGHTRILDASVETREDVLLSWLPSALTDPDEERRAPLVLPVPYEAELTWEIHAPPGFVASKLPQQLELQLGPASFTRSISRAKDNSVKVRTRFTTGTTRFSQEQVKAFREALWKYQQTLVPWVNFDHPAKKLSDSGNGLAAAALVRKEIQDDPKNAVARMRMAWTLAPYVLDAARSAAQKAVELAPANAQLHRELAALLSQNRFGKDLTKGFDRVGALSAYRRAFELDPEDTESRVRTAVLLEHDDDGRWYESDALDEAIQIYDSIPEKTLEEFEDGTFRNNVLFTLFWAKRYDELAQRLARRDRDDIPLELALMNAAMTRGVEGTLEEASRLGLSGNALAGALEAASGSLVQKREYAAALQLIEAAIGSSPDGTRLQNRARALRKVKRIDVANLPVGSPKQLVTKFIATAMSYPDDVHKVTKGMVSARAWYEPDKSTVRDFVEAMSSAARSQEVKSDILADFTVGGLDLRLEGDDQRGYKVMSKIDYGAGQQFNVFVVKEAGQYRVRAIGTLQGELGAEALHAAKHGQQKKASQWLDWARESFHAVGGEDPLRIAPFARLKKGRNKGDIRLAAAALTATSNHAKEAIADLENARAHEKEPERQRILEHALAQAYANADQPAKQLAVSRNLYGAFPKSIIARDLTLGALWQLERYSEYADEMRRLLKHAEKRDRAGLLARLAGALNAQRKLDQAHAVMLDLLETGDAHAGHYNDLAWVELFLGSHQEALEHALKSNEMQTAGPGLHTLACVYAELGRVDEARRTLEQLASYRKDGELLSVDWYVVGRIAEHFGLAEEARRAYRKVEKPEKPWPVSTYELAQRQLLRVKD